MHNNLDLLFMAVLLLMVVCAFYSGARYGEWRSEKRRLSRDVQQRTGAERGAGSDKPASPSEPDGLPACNCAEPIFKDGHHALSCPLSPVRSDPD